MVAGSHLELPPAGLSNTTSTEYDLLYKAHTPGTGPKGHHLGTRDTWRTTTGRDLMDVRRLSFRLLSREYRWCGAPFCPALCFPLQAAGNQTALRLEWENNVIRRLL